MNSRILKSAAQVIAVQIGDTLTTMENRVSSEPLRREIMSRELDRRNFSINKVTPARKSELDSLALNVSDRLPGAHRVGLEEFNSTTGSPSVVVSESAPVEKGNYLQRALDHMRNISQALGLTATQPVEFVADPMSSNNFLHFYRGQEASMPDTKTYSRVGVFLSYVHEDNDILQAVHRAFEVIRQQTQQQLEIFYDKKSIDGGDIFDNTIRDGLRKSDYLIILYSGAYKESHSYTGFELGYFASLAIAQSKSLDKVMADAPMGVGWSRRGGVATQAIGVLA